MNNHIHFMKLAIENARQALDAGEFPVGCVIADGSVVLADGARKNSFGNAPAETDHAEMNALNALEQQERDIGQSFDRSALALYSTLEPCLMCFGAILISDINTIVYAAEDVMGGGTSCDRAVLPPLYSERRVTIIPGVMREESEALLKEFFSNPDTTYLKDTMLAHHVLNS